MPPLSPAQFVLIGAAAIGGLAAIAAAFVPDRHSRVRSRIEGMRAETEEETQSVMPVLSGQLGAMGNKIAGSFLVGPKEEEKIIAQLGAAGISGREKVAIFLSAKLSIAVIMGILGWVFVFVLGIFASTWALRLTMILGCAWVGWRAPDFIVNGIAKRRKQRLRDGISDALDLMVICTESGLGLEQGMDRVARDIEISNPIVAGELKKTTAEMRVLPQMRDALDNLAKRSGLPIVKSVVTTLVQSIQYGTPLGHSLRVLSAEMRAHRMLEIEAKAARLPVLLTLPLILFILPCLFLVVAGPAILNTVRTLAHL